MSRATNNSKRAAESVDIPAHFSNMSKHEYSVDDPIKHEDDSDGSNSSDNGSDSDIHDVEDQVQSSEILKQILSQSQSRIGPSEVPPLKEERRKASTVIDLYPTFNPYTMVHTAWIGGLIRKLFIHKIRREVIPTLCVELFSAKADNSKHTMYNWWHVWQETLLLDSPDYLNSCLERFRTEFGTPVFRVSLYRYLLSGLSKSKDANRPKNEAWFSELQQIVSDLMIEIRQPDAKTTAARQLQLQDELRQMGTFVGMACHEAYSVIKAIQIKASLGLEEAANEHKHFFVNVKTYLQLNGIVREVSKPRGGKGQNQHAKTDNDLSTANSQTKNEVARVPGFKTKNTGFSNKSDI